MEKQKKKTVESYRIALEEEIHRWDGFAKALLGSDKEAFEALMDVFKSIITCSTLLLLQCSF
jgi:hypothetical protein